MRGTEKGVWDSIHVVEVIPEGSKASYKLTTTIILSLKTKEGNLDLSGSVQKQEKMDAKVDKINTHLVNIGNLIQKMENQLYGSLQQVYFDKAREITRTLRSTQSKADKDVQNKLTLELVNALSNRKR